jgi:hypothetical protein
MFKLQPQLADHAADPSDPAEVWMNIWLLWTLMVLFLRQGERIWCEASEQAFLQLEGCLKELVYHWLILEHGRAVESAGNSAASTPTRFLLEWGVWTLECTLEAAQASRSKRAGSNNNNNNNNDDDDDDDDHDIIKREEEGEATADAAASEADKKSAAGGEEEDGEDEQEEESARSGREKGQFVDLKQDLQDGSKQSATTPMKHSNANIAAAAADTAATPAAGAGTAGPTPVDALELDYSKPNPYASPTSMPIKPPKPPAKPPAPQAAPQAAPQETTPLSAIPGPTEGSKQKKTPQSKAEVTKPAAGTQSQMKLGFKIKQGSSKKPKQKKEMK